MASVNITGAELLDSLEEWLQHMLDCEQLIFDLYDHPDKLLTKDYGKDFSQWDRDQLQYATNYVLRYRGTTELVEAQLKALRPIEMFLVELPRLRQAADVVSRLHVLRYRLPEVSREEHVEMHKAGKRTLRERLDSLTNFDDSE